MGDGRNSENAGGHSKKKDEILYTQIVAFAAEMVFATGFLAAPRFVTPIAANAAWICMIVGGAIGVGLALLTGWIVKRFPNQTLVPIVESLFSAPVGKIIGLSFVIYCTAILALASRQFVLAISIPFLHSTPPSIVSGVFFLLLAYAAYLGIEPIARVSMVSFGIVLASLALLTVLAIPVSVPGRLLPILGSGLVSILRGGLAAASYAAEVVVLLAFAGSMKDPEEAPRALATGTAIGTAVMVLDTVFGIMMLGYAGLTRVTFPAVETARMVGIGEFLERAEIVFLTLWFSVALLKLAAVLYAAVTSCAEVFNLKDYRPLILPYVIFSMTLSLLPGNIVESFILVHLFSSYTLYYVIALLALILIGAAVASKRARGRRGNAR